VFSAKQRRNFESLSLKMPPQAEEVIVDEPSALHFIQKRMGAFGGCIHTLNFLRMMKSDIEDEATVLDRLLERETFEMIVEMVDLQ